MMSLNQGKQVAILLIVQNNSFPFDKRVWKEASSLRDAGYEVVVISPKSNIDPLRREIVEGIKVFRYTNFPSNGSFFDFFLEYLFAVLKIFALYFQLQLRFRFSVVHVANPPDFFWTLGLIAKLFGTKFIYDQHDLVPEMYRNKFGEGMMYRFMRLNEYLSVLCSDIVIVTNTTFQKRSMKHWSITSDLYKVVYNGPLDSFNPQQNLELQERYKNKKVILYVGLMTKNDNIEIILEAAKKIIVDQHRTDCIFILLGGGDVENEMKSSVDALGLSDYVEFKGIVQHKEVMEYLDIASVCIAPDLPNGLNESLTLVKVLEYMKAGKPFVTFRLDETMDIANGCGLFAINIDDYVEKILLLIDNVNIGKDLGKKGQQRINVKYLWKYCEACLIQAYEMALKK